MVAGRGDDRSAAAEPSESWDEVVREPVGFLGRTVRFVVQFHSLDERWNPYVTRFGPRDYVALNGWTDEQRLWIRSEYDDPVVRIFVRRDGGLAALFAGLEGHERVAVTCVVRELFAGRPWAEVVEATKLAEYVPEGSVLHAIRALDFMALELFELAAGQVDRALDAPVPERVRAELEGWRERCLAEKRVKNGRRIPAPSGARKPHPGARRRE